MEYISILEALYIFYMYNVFKTSISVHHPLEFMINNLPLNNFFKHPVYSGNYENKICMLGKIVSWLLIIWILTRKYMKPYVKNIPFINKLIFILLFVGTLLMNLNAFLYMAPVFLYEYYTI